ncbi:uncharacterized protein LOC124820895 [Vigna umbellata]|uniref:uncharacterized protein LOC124820895 n=1 Tax=Vigna umbellata TaxID=87088 RepID=UPI001F5F6CC5|nr:uncharacterized protein LOC124820895 [Vigna umbellata]
MGKFVINKGLQYVGGEIHVIKGFDLNRWSYFEAVGIVKEFKYDADFKLWWKGLKQRLMNNVRLLSDDREALYLAHYVEKNKEEVEIYVQHVSSEAVEVHFLSCGEVADEGEKWKTKRVEGLEEGDSVVEEGECVEQQGSHVNVVVEVEMGEEECDGGEEHEEVEMGEEREECDGGHEQEELKWVRKKKSVIGGDEHEGLKWVRKKKSVMVVMNTEEVEMGEEEEECDGGDEHDYLREEEEGGMCEGSKASAEECLDDMKKTKGL